MKPMQALADSSSSRPARRAQRGVSMLFALVALVMLTLGAVALVRSIDTGTLVLGNLGFKQDALSAGSVGTERAIGWLQANMGATLDKDQLANGYSSVAMPKLDPTGRTLASSATSLVLVDWSGANSCDPPGRNGRPVVCLPASAEIAVNGGNKVRYVITRLCAASGPPDATNDCVLPVASTGGGSSQRGSLGYGGSTRFVAQSLGTYYRIITRTEGVRGTVAYTETLVHF